MTVKNGLQKQKKNNKNNWNYIDKTFAFRLFGKTVFLTKKEAEKALKGQ